MPALSVRESAWSVSAEEVSRLLATDIQAGLTPSEVEKRLSQYGRNVVAVPKRTPRFKIIGRQFASPLIIILVVAAAITFFIEHYRDAIFILVAVIVNACLGYYQENKAEQAIADLDTYLEQRSRVVRAGVERWQAVEELVPGDIVKLSQGDRVPADGRIIYLNDLQIDEAVLTGESLPVGKTIENSPADAGLADRRSVVFAGTLVTQGVATVVVYQTGKNTEFGKIATVIAASENTETPLQKSIRRFSLQASMVLGILTALVFIGGVWVGYSMLDMFLTAVAIAVSAIPEGLPIALTVILSVGVQRMAKRKGVVRQLIAAETLGGTTTILTDKTGTLTMARMELAKVVSLNSLSEEALLELGLTAVSVVVENPTADPTAWILHGKIMETALVRGAASRGITSNTDSKKVLEVLPFNAVNKFAVSLISDNGKRRLVFFGAPDILLKQANLAAGKKAELLNQINELASAGQRVLGIASKEVDASADFSLTKDLTSDDLVFEGLVVFNDPVRPNVKEAIGRVVGAGIRVVVMTGDHSGTARAIAAQVGLTVADGSVLDATELATLSDEQLLKRLPHLNVISRVTPLDKLRIAGLYQSLGEVVAMTGDGVNDAPAIKQADVGIAMGSGTEVARSVADLVLLDDNFETIVAAVEEGRQIMANIRKVLVYLLSNVTDGLILIGGSLAFGLALPLNPLQILWVNFFSDSFPAVAFAFEKESHVLATKSFKKNQGLFDPLMRFLILTIGLSTSALLFILYWLLLYFGFEQTLVRTFIFAAFGTYTLFVALSVRSLDKSILAYPFFSNRYMLAGIGAGVLLMLVAIYVPFMQSLLQTVALPAEWLVAVVAVGLVNIIVIEIGKWLFRRKSAQ